MGFCFMRFIDAEPVVELANFVVVKYLEHSWPRILKAWMDPYSCGIVKRVVFRSIHRRHINRVVVHVNNLWHVFVHVASRIN